MTESPERIWAGKTDGFGGWHECPDFVNNTPYIRADIHDAAVSAARKEGMLEGLERARAVCRDVRSAAEDDAEAVGAMDVWLGIIDLIAAAEATP